MTDLFSLGPILTMTFGPTGHILFARFGPMLQNVVLPSLIDNHPLYLEDLIFKNNDTTFLQTVISQILVYYHQLL